MTNLGKFFIFSLFLIFISYFVLMDNEVEEMEEFVDKDVKEESSSTFKFEKKNVRYPGYRAHR